MPRRRPQGLQQRRDRLQRFRLLQDRLTKQFELKERLNSLHEREHDSGSGSIDFFDQHHQYDKFQQRLTSSIVMGRALPLDLRLSTRLVLLEVDLVAGDIRQYLTHG